MNQSLELANAFLNNIILCENKICAIQIVLSWTHQNHDRRYNLFLTAYELFKNSSRIL